MLSQAAKEEGVWLVGGALVASDEAHEILTIPLGLPGSIPELSPDDKIYNSSPTFNRSGELVALHRKVHLFDIDIPGGITFKESETLTGGDRITIVETGKLPPRPSSASSSSRADRRSRTPCRVWQDCDWYLLRCAIPRVGADRRSSRCAFAPCQAGIGAG